MKKDNFSIVLDNFKEYIGTSIWEQENNKSTYYDRKLDTQGIVPGCSVEEAMKAFEEEYGITL